MKLLKWLDEHFEEYLLMLLLALISCVELMQVIIRNIPWLPALTWAEEFCRFCWIWSVFLSLPYTIRRAGMLRVGVILSALPKRGREWLGMLADAVTLLCMLVLGISSVGVVSGIARSGESSPAMAWPMWVVYSVMLPGFLGGAVRAAQQIILRLRRMRRGGQI